MMRLAIIGGGPRAIWAVERLTAWAAQPIEVHVYDPHPIGHGAAYDPNQPAWLRLNVRSAAVDPNVGGAQPTLPRLPILDEWRGDDVADQFPPRRIVGRYLAELWADVSVRSPFVRCTHHAIRVQHLARTDECWHVAGDDYDAVLVATGHAPDWDGALRHHPGAGDLIDHVYPTDDIERVAPRARVLVRGAALTFIDAALTWTQGRGGRFTADGYVPSGAEPVILPTSRSGRFMVPKPVTALDADRFARFTDAMPDAEAGIDQMLAAAADLFGGPDRRGEVEAVVWGDQEAVDPVEQLRHDIAVASGEAPPDPEWALGQAWRGCYHRLVEVLPTADDWSRVAHVAHRLERVAFGPPLINARKMLALCEAGVIDATHMTGQPPDHDVVVDAVLPPPGAREARDPLLDDLVSRGFIRLHPGRRGVVVDEALGTGSPGLAVVGRACEDVIMGHDTLTRTLHPQLDRWASALTGGTHD